MCKKKTTCKYLEFPIFSILCHKNFTVIAGGGGGKEFGIENRLIVFEKSEILSKKIFEKDTGKDLIENLIANDKNNLLACNSGSECLVYQIKENGTLVDVWRKMTDTEEQKAAIFTYEGDLLITGGLQGVITIWSVSSKSEKIEIAKKSEIKHHSKAINHLGVSIDDAMLVSASEDKTCRVTNLQSGELIKKLTFSDGSPSNMRFSFCFFSQDEKYIYTVQSQVGQGPSYLTEWDAEGEFEPVETIKLHDKAVTSACMSQDGLYLGVGTVDGAVKIINARYVELENQSVIHDLITKSVSFTVDSRQLASASPDYSYNLLPNVRPQGLFAKITKFWVAAMILIYLFMSIKDSIPGFRRH